MTKDALLEIGCEELPASFVPLGLSQLKTLAETSLKTHQLSFKEISVYGTPRRLAVCISDLAERSSDQERVVQGPPAAIAKEPAGEWSQAALGFARKQGIKPSDLVIQENRLCAVEKTKGVATRLLLAELFPEWIGALQFPKSMEWEPSHFRFPRPIRWLAALFGQDLVSFSLAGVRSGRWTYGLSLQSSKKIPIPSAGKYLVQLKNQCVLVDPAARQDAIRRLAEQAVRRIHGHVLMKPALLEQLTHLVEHPAAILGNFNPAYLDIPREVLVTCMEHHQKFFPIEAAGEGAPVLMPHFIGIRNGLSVHQELVREGYERVLSARLADARFFYTQDRKVPLAQKVEGLRGVALQGALGTLFDKKERVKALLTALAEHLPARPDWLSGALRAAELCKADLVTEMVREFPELQGIVARLYALADSEEPNVAQALEQHYWPLTASGELPKTDLAAALSLADKLDTLAGDFAIGLIPSGSADPYGLRRAAIGVLRILEHFAWPVSLNALVEQAFEHLPPAVSRARDKAKSELIAFLKQRWAAVLEERGYRFDEIEAILTSGLGVIPETLARLAALHEIRTRTEFGPLSIAFKRAMNIVRQAQQKGQLPAIPSGGNGNTIQTALLQEASEQALYQMFQDIHGHVEAHLQERAYRQALESMVLLRDPLDRFFEGVMVMAEDASVRANRLSLLSGIVNLFLKVADFSKLQNA